MEEKQYLSPAVQVLELYSEGVLCASSGTETLEENEGIWYFSVSPVLLAKSVPLFHSKEHPSLSFKGASLSVILRSALLCHSEERSDVRIF